MQNVFSEGCLGLFENLLRVFECYSFETEYCLLVDKYLVVPVGISDPFACLLTLIWTALLCLLAWLYIL